MLHGGDKVGGYSRLHHITECSCRQPRAKKIRIRVHREKDNLGSLARFSQFRHYFDAAHDGHRDVNDQYIRLKPLHPFIGGLSISRRSHDVKRMAEETRNLSQNIWMVVRDKDSDSTHRCYFLYRELRRTLALARSIL